MTTVRAPYPSKMDEIHNQSVVSFDRPGAGDVANFRNRSSIVESLIIRNNPSTMVKAIRRVGAVDIDAKDIILRDWYRPFTPAFKIPSSGINLTSVANASSWSPEGLYLAVAHTSSPYFSIYMRSSTIYGIDTLGKLANPGALPASPVLSINWNENGSAFYVTCQDKTCYVYTRTVDTIPPTLSWAASGVNVFNPVPTASAIT